MRALVQDALDRIVAHIESLPTQTVSDTSGGFALAESLAEALPETGTPAAELLDLFFQKALPPTFNTASPGYLAYIPGGGLFHAAVADLIADATNRYSSVYAAAPALARIEMNVIDWFCRARRLSARGAGDADQRRLARQLDRPGHRPARTPARELPRRGRSTPPTSPTTRSPRAAILAGFPEANVREVPTDDRYRLRVDALAERIAEDRRHGLHPLPDRRRRRHHQHRRRRSAPRAGRPRRPGGALAARRRRLWRLLPADRRGEDERFAASSGPTRSCSIPTRGSSSPTAPAPC